MTPTHSFKSDPALCGKARSDQRADYHRALSIKAGRDGSFYTLADKRRVEANERSAHDD